MAFDFDMGKGMGGKGGASPGGDGARWTTIRRLWLSVVGLGHAGLGILSFPPRQPKVRANLEFIPKVIRYRFQDSSYCNRETPKSLPSLSPFQCRGPQCVFSCANEHRSLSKQKFTCCLALDGVNVLASGFEADEKVKIKNLVTSMGGVLHTKTSLDVSFVIAKNALAAKYKVSYLKEIYDWYFPPFLCSGL
ncbi:uncharacterized protein LOC112177743 [Rosa chinensis]|uniref:uncharacterized protein LOC112177743 n=1 Tax=Rosa chinensis TaxID=74649 RepID=UPI000D09066A|nr:uncharacterized protein LOC112177743 [Rosa chinensis]